MASSLGPTLGLGNRGPRACELSQMKRSVSYCEDENYINESEQQDSDHHSGVFNVGSLKSERRSGSNCMASQAAAIGAELGAAASEEDRSSRKGSGILKWDGGSDRDKNRQEEARIVIDDEELKLGVPPLIVAARAGNDEEVQKLLERPETDVNIKVRGGITALHVASFCGHVKVVKKLLNFLTRPPEELLNARTPEEKFTALHMAACNRDVSIVREIWDAFKRVAGVSQEKLTEAVNAEDCIGWTPLHHAAWLGHTSVVNEILLWKVVDVNAEDGDSFTALHLASWKGHSEVVASILNHRDPEESEDAEPNKLARSNQRTQDDLLKMQKDVDWVKLPRPRLTDYALKEARSRVTALHYAVEKNWEAVVVALLGNALIDVHVENSEGKSAFDMAVKQSNGTILWKLLENYREKPEFWETLRSELSIRGYKRLLKGEDSQEKRLNNCGVLLKAALTKSEDGDEIHFLLTELENQFLSINTQIPDTKDDVTLLHHAAFAGLEKIVEILTDIPGMDVNIKDSDSQTPLHYAALAGNSKVVIVLLKNSACRANAEDRFGRTALQVAVECRRPDVEKLLLERADVRDYVDRFYRNRQVYVDAANAMLLGAALIASVTFAGWLQPPAGFTPYYQLETEGVLNSYQSYASVEQHLSTRVFWVFNSLSFFFSIATVIAGAGAVLPTLDVFIGQEVRLVKRTLVATSTLLVFAVVFILGAFGAAGYASLPPIPKYEKPMTYTVVLGGISCLVSMCWFLKRLYGIRPTWWRKLEESIKEHLPFREKIRFSKDVFSKPRYFPSTRNQ